MRRRKAIARVLLPLSCGALLAIAPAARALNSPEKEAAAVEARTASPYAYAHVRDPHDPTQAMHPVRVAAYALHPVGVLLDYVLVRPAVWIARQQPFRTIFGYED